MGSGRDHGEVYTSSPRSAPHAGFWRRLLAPLSTSRSPPTDAPSPPTTAPSASGTSPLESAESSSSPQNKAGRPSPPDGRYKIHGDINGRFWHVIGLCRFEPGELDDYLDAFTEHAPRRLALNEPFDELAPSNPPTPPIAR